MGVSALPLAWLLDLLIIPLHGLYGAYLNCKYGDNLVPKSHEAMKLKVGLENPSPPTYLSSRPLGGSRKSVPLEVS